MLKIIDPKLSSNHFSPEEIKAYLERLNNFFWKDNSGRNEDTTRKAHAHRASV